MDGGARGAERGERRIAGNCGNANDPGGTMGLEADSDREDYRGFFEWQHAWVRGDRIEFCGRGRVRCGASAGGGEGEGRRALFAGRRESDTEAVAGHFGAYHRAASAIHENSAWRGARRG